MSEAQSRPPRRTRRPRDAEATRARILSAAKAEFAANGLGGARVDEIAARSEANKRMIYHYFGGKEELFQAVIEDAYLGIRRMEQELALDHLPPVEALETLVRRTWEYYLAHPEFLTLVNSENLHRARHVRRSEAIKRSQRGYVETVTRLLDRGVALGVFRPGVDPVQLAITIAAVGYYYLTNRHTAAVLFGRDMMTTDALAGRLRFNVETILRLVAADPAAGAGG